MSNKPAFKADLGAGARIAAEIRKKNKEAYEEFEANFEKIAEGLRAWELALKRSTRLVDRFEEVR